MRILLVLIALFIFNQQFNISQERSIQPFKKPLKSEQSDAIHISPNVDKIFSYPTSGAIELTKEIKEYLEITTIYLKENPGSRVSITGHSDDLGTFYQNDERAKQRAKIASDFLIKNGIDSSRILTYRKGSIEPISSNKTEVGRLKNRRLVVRIIPSTENYDIRK